jgi:hypothetical protein
MVNIALLRVGRTPTSEIARRIAYSTLRTAVHDIRMRPHLHERQRGPRRRMQIAKS